MFLIFCLAPLELNMVCLPAEASDTGERARPEVRLRFK